MNDTDPVGSRYFGHEYLAANPSWDSEDSPWKANLVAQILARHGITPASVVDVGCGAGLVLAELRRALPQAALRGFDVAPDASRFWSAHADPKISFAVGDFLSQGDEVSDVILALDVLEHLADPLGFLARLRQRGRHFVFHLPLDLSALSVIREKPLLHVRRTVGHIHYFTKGLALEMMRECGFEVMDAQLTGAAFSAPNRRLLTRIASAPRRIARLLLGSNLSSRVLGGETLLILAKPAR